MPGLGAVNKPPFKSIQHSDFLGMPDLDLGPPMSPPQRFTPPFLDPGLPAPFDLDGFDPHTAMAKEIASQFRAEIKLPGLDDQTLPELAALPALPHPLPPPPALPKPKNYPATLGNKRRGGDLQRGVGTKTAKTGTYRIRIKDLGWFKLPHGYIPVRNTDLI
jgi:hypothetical protein